MGVHHEQTDRLHGTERDPDLNFWAEDHHPKFSDKPIWVSGSKNCGGDGNARLLDVDQDGDLDLVTSAPNPSRWVVFEIVGGKLAEKPMWESKATTDCDHISVLDFNKDGMPENGR